MKTIFALLFAVSTSVSFKNDHAQTTARNTSVSGGNGDNVFVVWESSDHATRIALQYKSNALQINARYSDHREFILVLGQN